MVVILPERETHFERENERCLPRQKFAIAFVNNPLYRYGW